MLKMHISYHIQNPALFSDKRVAQLFEELEKAGFILSEAVNGGAVCENADMLLSIGGDGTFLSAASIAAKRGIPVLGVNAGRLGFLSENAPEGIAETLKSGNYGIEEREMLCATLSSESGRSFHALNEITVSRMGAGMLGVDVTIDSVVLPTYWADGLLVATGSGSTAYSLSVGGPICMPELDAHIIAPISPHNLNLRPLVVPSSRVVGITVHSRDGKARFSYDNCNMEIPDGTAIEVKPAEFKLKRVVPQNSDFIGALKSKLHWGDDIRNIE